MQVSTRKVITLQKTDANLVAYGGTRIETMGLAMLSCCLKEQHHTIPFFIVDSDVQPLLGFRACVDMGVVRMSPAVHQVTMDSNADFRTQTLRQYKDVFDDELGKLPVTYSKASNASESRAQLHAKHGSYHTCHRAHRLGSLWW